ncbi:hypothetical protein BC937DRAFT_92548 [Endogone sp. FLAS-F59071]|nr:hypothetical protein BC937DRAFT_92548 [Endogone sp. FLAS-F59071]|eukprot:RUS15359.1 hypothetical protein BC937DRAFT_92548 [Endogone sp. FLAS-F59071]
MTSHYYNDTRPLRILPIPPSGRLSYTESAEPQELGHISLNNLTKNKIIDQVIGVVTGDKPAAKSRGSDFSKFLMIVDPSLYRPGESPISLNLFKPQENLLPDIREVGDIILCQFNGKAQAVSIKAVSSWATFDGDPNAPLEPRPTTWSENIRVNEQQRNIVRMLREWWHRQSAEAEAQQALSTKSPSMKSVRPLLTTAEITSDKFLDYVGESMQHNHHTIIKFMVHIHRLCPFTFSTMSDLIDKVTHDCSDPDPNRSLMTLYLTDYTENSLLDVDLGHNPLGVTGQRILRCNLWDQNVSAARAARITVGTFVFLRNAKSMLDDMGYLRLVVHGDKIRPEGANVTRIKEDDPRIEDLLKRRQEYRDTMAKERQIEERRAREEGERRAREKAEQARQPTYQTIIKHTSIMPTRIADVLRSQVPNKYRIKARVIDMWPSMLEKLARPYCKACNLTLEPARDLDTTCPHCAAPMFKDAYMYRFVFRIQDEHGTTMPVIVCLDDANVFLAGLPPTNLYENNCTLQALRNRLSKLCDLDAIARPLPDRPPPSGNPFLDWCVKSFVPDGGNRRQYRVFDTSTA